MASNPFPSGLYRMIPALYPHFAEILRSVGLSGREFLALSYIKNSGREVGKGLTCAPIADLKALLIKMGEYKGDSGASSFIHELEKKKYVEPRKLTLEEKAAHFPESTGHRDTVSITPVGLDQLQSVNAKVEQLYREMTVGLSGKLLKACLSAFAKLAEPLIERLDQRARELKG